MSIAIGDSNTAGYGAIGWPDLLGWTNYGVPGSTVRWWVRRPELLSTPIDGVLAIQLGTNDALALQVGPSHLNMLSYLVTLGRTAGADQVLLIGPPPVIAGALVNAEIAEYNGYRHQICDAFEWVSCDVDFGTLSTDMLQRDGLHLNDIGQHAASEMIPEPGTALLLTIGLVVLAVVSRAKKSLEFER